MAWQARDQMAATAHAKAATEVWDYLILGAGPAGLQLGYYLQRSGREHLILEATDAPGAFFKRLPRHRKLISINKRFTGFDDPDVNLRWDWNSLLSDGFDHPFTTYNGDYFPDADDYVRYLGDFAARHRLNIRFNSKVTGISRDRLFRLQLSSGDEVRARRLIVATGKAKPYRPDIAGSELCESYLDCSIDAAEFENLRVLVIGKGNSGFETAENLINSAATIHVLSPHPVRLAWRSHYVGDLRAVNNNFLDTYQLKSQNAVLDAVIEGIEKLEDGKLAVDIRFSHANGQRHRLLVDRAILCTGFRFDDSIFDPQSCPIKLSECGRFPAMTSAWESISTPDLFFAGTLMHVRDYRKSFSGFVHGFRYNIRTLHRLLEERYEAVPLGYETLPLDPDAIVERVIQRVTHCSSLFQQPAFLVDVFLMRAATGSVRIYQDLPVDLVAEREEFSQEPHLVLSLEYGHLSEGMDPLNVQRSPSDGASSTYIHPAIRYFEGKSCQQEHHIPEDLENRWDGDNYVEPFRRFLHDVLSRLQAPVGASE